MSQALRSFEPEPPEDPFDPAGVHVLLVDDSPSDLEPLAMLLQRDGYRLRTVTSADEALAAFDREPAHVVVTDFIMPGKNGADLAKSIRERSSSTAILVLTGQPGHKHAVSSIKNGAVDYLCKPYEPRRIREIVAELARQVPVDLPLRAYGPDSEIVSFDGLVARSKVMKQFFQQIESAARSDAPVLVCGESGTGKEVVAQALHRRSARSKGPLATVHAGALPPELVGAELFGREQGPAGPARTGRVVEATHGTLFLDEVNALEARAQSALLGVIESGAVVDPVSGEPGLVDVRVVASTQRELSELVRSGQFREDLYYRLNVMSLRVPPLRDRREDIAVLTQHFADQFARRYRKPSPSASPAVLDLLLRYPWPGNVRELRNVVEHMVVLSADGRLTEDLLPRMVAGSADDSDFVRIPLGTKMKDLERTMIARTLDANHWNKQQAAKALGISRRSLYNKLDRYKISRGVR
jgi:two-component system response regulator HydG